jgi:hypothetical protein
MLKGGKTPKEEGKIEVGKGEKTDAVQKKNPKTKGQPNFKKAAQPKKKNTT